MRLILGIALVLTCLLGGGHSMAQDEVGWGGISMGAFPGYSYYALPVANAGKGRDWVKTQGLQWQVGYNYSVIPVRIEFEHRMPNAFRGRIEIESPESFYAEEASGSFPAVYSQDMLVPPSVPHTYMFAPRVCSQSQISGPVEFTVRLYKDGMENPYVTQAVSTIQLEPGYLHSLWLDGSVDPTGNPAVLTDHINPENKLNLRFPDRYSELEEILSSLHFIISVDHRQVTGLPLAARDFAFVVGDLSQIRMWSQEEQVALVSYMTGGGHLCVYNSGVETWMGLSLDQSSAVGRGFLISVSGEMRDARIAMREWLEGEFEEFVVWSGGASSGWRMDEDYSNWKYGGGLTYLESLMSEQSDREVISHRPGYLNPILVYRETCRSGASEAWESAQTLSLNSKQDNQRVSDLPSDEIYSAEDVELSHLATQQRLLPNSLSVLLPACPLLILLAVLFRRQQVLAIGVLSLMLAVGVFGTMSTESNPPGCANLVLIDVDTRCEAGSLRYITATSSGTNGVINAIMGRNPIVRHLAMDNHSSWQIHQTRDASSFQTTSIGSRAVLSSDATGLFHDELPVDVSVDRDANGSLNCTLDVRKLPPDAKCLVQLPSGWVVLQGGQNEITVSLRKPKIFSKPGKARLQAWSDYFAQIKPPIDDAYFEVIQSSRASQKFITGSFDNQSTQQELKLFGWNHVMKFPTGLRGAMQNQGVIYVENPPHCFATGLDGREAVFWRITFPLEDF